MNTIDPTLFNLPEDVNISISTLDGLAVTLSIGSASVRRSESYLVVNEGTKKMPVSPIRQELIDDMYIELRDEVEKQLDKIERFKRTVKDM